MDLAGLVGEVRADIVGILLHILAQAGGELAKLARLGSLGAGRLLGAGDGGRHDGFLDPHGIADRAAQMTGNRLLVEGRAVAKPAFEFVPLVAP